MIESTSVRFTDKLVRDIDDLRPGANCIKVTDEDLFDRQVDSPSREVDLFPDAPPTTVDRAQIRSDGGGYGFGEKWIKYFRSIPHPPK